MKGWDEMRGKRTHRQTTAQSILIYLGESCLAWHGIKDGYFLVASQTVISFSPDNTIPGAIHPVTGIDHPFGIIQRQYNLSVSCFFIYAIIPWSPSSCLAACPSPSRPVKLFPLKCPCFAISFACDRPSERFTQLHVYYTHIIYWLYGLMQ